MSSNVLPHDWNLVGAPPSPVLPVEADARGSERSLIERLSKDDATALDDILREAWTPVVNYVRAILQSRDEAQDVAQEAFIKLWEHRSRLDRGGSVRGFVYAAARNLAISRLRSNSAAERAVTSLALNQEFTLEIEFHSDHLSAAVAAAIAELPPRRREILLLHVVHELSYKEVAAALQIAPQTVANQCASALATLRQRLSPNPMV